MGTLFDQQPRHEASNIRNRDGLWVESVLSDLRNLKVAQILTVDQALDVLKLALERERFEYWRNDLDVRDEQISGMGRLLESISENLDDIAEELAKIRDENTRRA